jgi:hypothetical protein
LGAGGSVVDRPAAVFGVVGPVFGGSHVDREVLKVVRIRKVEIVRIDLPIG